MSQLSVIDWMALSFVPGLGSKGILQLIRHFGSPRAAFLADKQALTDCGVRKNVCLALTNPAPLRDKAKLLLNRLHGGGADAVGLDDARYPQSLKEIADPPPVLYVQGRVELLDSPCLAMVGSRAATAYGKRSSLLLAQGLASAGITVVSGLAAGIDSEAHRGALSVKGATIGVLGCGLDVVYPAQNRCLYDEIRKEGLLVSEYPLGTKPDGFRFPARNRIISGLSKGVVVVEAARKSGSLITAEMALDEGREVFAVPGQIDSFKSSGAHWLLQQGATLVQSVDDILLELGCGPGESVVNKKSLAIDATIDPDARDLLENLEVYSQSRNEIIADSGLGPAKVTELLLLLELEGLIEILPGDEIRRIA